MEKDLSEISNKLVEATIAASNSTTDESRHLNQYHLREEIGQGSYGMVKLAYNEADQSYYAMKILSKKKLLRKAGLIGRLPPSKRGKARSTPLNNVYQEIALLKKLDHPNIVKLVEVLDDPGQDKLYMVFELMAKGEVMEIPTTDTLSENLAKSYFRDSILGLEYLHFQKIIHRDIKPSNLLLDDRGRVKIADLGVSQELLNADDQVSSTAGTPAFHSPEAVSPQCTNIQGKPLDIWAMGVTLYCFLYGNVPFDNANMMDLHRQILNDPLVFPSSPSIEKSCQDLISKMMIKDPSQRIAMQDIKTHPWVTCGGNNPMVSRAENCHKVTVTEEDIKDSVKHIPRLEALILVKSMLKRKSFRNPLLTTPSTGPNPT